MKQLCYNVITLRNGKESKSNSLKHGCCISYTQESGLMRENLQQTNKLYIVMYHYTRDLVHSRYPRIKGLELTLFRKQILFFKQTFHVVSMEEVLGALNGQVKLPENALLLTFDDGYLDNYTYAMPILEEAKMQGSFFIPGKTFSEHKLLDVNKIHYILAAANLDELLSDVLERMNFYRGNEYDFPENKELFAEYAKANRFDAKEVIFIKRMLQTVLPERLRNQIASDLFEKYVGVTEEQLAYELYMTRQQIWTMKQHGMFIGVHGYDHYWLGNLPREKMQNDIHMALEVMDGLIDRNCWVMNYPYGNYNKDVIDYARSQGACAGFTTEVRAVEIGRDQPFELPRFDCNDFPPKSENYKEY